MATRISVLAVAAMLAIPPTLASAWETTVGSNTGKGWAIATDAGSRLFTGGGLDGGFVVLALDDTTGAELWRFVIAGAATDLAVDGAGDVVALGLVETGISVVKLDGATGTELWRRDFPDPFYAGDLAVDGAGDVIVAAGARFFAAGGALLKLDGATGSDLWQEATCPFGPIAVDAVGDVFSVADAIVPMPELCKIDGATGTPLWTQATPQRATDVAVDSLGDVAMTGDGFLVLKLAGNDGALQWQHSFGPPSLSSAEAVAIDSAGDVIAGGDVPFPWGDFAVVKFDGVSGVEEWRRPAWGGKVRDLAVTTAGNVVAGVTDVVTLYRGSDGNPLWLSDGGAPLVLDANDHVSSIPDDKGFGGWRVVKTGGPLTGRGLAVLDTPAGTKLALKVKDHAILMPQIFSTTGGLLNPIQVGAVLELHNLSTAESDTISLPAVNWKAPGKFGVLKYLDRDGSEGPCRKATLTRKVLKVSCKGSAFTLDEPNQGSLTVTLTFGGNPLGRQCAEFGGTVRADVPGAFKAKNAPPPPLCP